MRTVKRVYENNELIYTYIYIWSGDVLLGCRLTSHSNGEIKDIRYLYDESGELYGMDYNGTGYFAFIKNLQGDIVSIVPLDTESNIELNMEYDAWGRPIFKQASSAAEAMLMTMIIGATNVAYRGYFYDFDTGLYYLRSRYYDPETGRFINADDTDYLGYDESPASLNLFAYCCNDPVNSEDHSGYYSAKDAINYAKKWWNSSNPSYKKNDSDCANFVSQCLYAGRLSKMSGVGKYGWHHYVVRSRPIYNQWGYVVKYVPYSWQISNAWGKAPDLRDWLLNKKFAGNVYTFTNGKNKSTNDYKRFINLIKNYSNGKSLIFFMRCDSNTYNHVAISGTYKNNDLYYYGHTDPRNGDGNHPNASLLQKLQWRVGKNNLSGSGKFDRKYLNNVYYKKVQVITL